MGRAATNFDSRALKMHLSHRDPILVRLLSWMVAGNVGLVTGMNTSSQDLIPRALLRPAEAAQALGLSLSTAYELMASGALASVKVGWSRRVPQQAIQQFVESLLEEQGVTL